MNLKPVLLQTLALLLLALGLSSCGFAHKFWGEAPPPQKIIVVEGTPLPSFFLIFDDDDRVAKETLKIWTNDLRNTFGQIQGEKQDFLSIAEIQTLIRKGYVKIDRDPDLSTRKVKGVLRLLGFKDGISKQNVEQLLKWLEDNRVRARTFYKLFVSTSINNNPVTSRELVQVVQLFGSFIGLGGAESLVPSDMDEILKPWIPDGYPHAKIALQSGVELGISFFASLCGDRVELNRWNGRKIGQCLHDLTDHFAASAPVFDYVFGQLNPFEDRAKLEAANNQLVSAVESWLKDHKHPLFPTTRVAKFAHELDIPAPYAFFDLTSWLPKLNADSSKEAFSPTLFVDVAHFTQDWITTFVKLTTDENCSVKDWKTCEFKGEYEVADKLYNDEYATLTRTKNVGFINKIALYDSISKFLMSKFDPEGDGLASDGIKELITISVRLMDSNAFAFNVLARLQERDFDPSMIEISLKGIQRQGLSELAALASDLIPERGTDHRSFLKRIQVQIYDNTNRVAYTMDQLGITAFLYIYDLMTSMRAEYLAKYDLPVKAEGPLTFVKRRKIVESMPRMLYDYFPRIYNECLEWGFERTCGVLYTEVLPSPMDTPKGKRDDLETYEIDMMTLSSILLESMFNRCDRNGDDKIGTTSWWRLDGNTEKSCVIAVATSLVNRLMAANIIDRDPKAEKLMGLVKKIPPLRWIAKVALARGSAKGAGMIVRAIPPVSLFSKAASMGSIISIAGEVMDDDKTKSIDLGIMGKVEDPGDELIFLDQLTKGYLPSQNPAKRTSEKAKSWTDDE